MRTRRFACAWPSAGTSERWAVVSRAHPTPCACTPRLGIHRPRPRRRWTDSEDVLIHEGYTSALGCAEIARQLPRRSAASVAARAGKLGLASYGRRWSTQDNQRLAQLTAREATLEDVAQRLGRTPEALRRRAARLGAKPPRPAPAPRRARPWTGEEDELLRLHHALNPARLAELLGRSDAAAPGRLLLRPPASPRHRGRPRDRLINGQDLATLSAMLAGPDWERLQVFAPGPQRPLWASTGTKTDDATPSRPTSRDWVRTNTKTTLLNATRSGRGDRASPRSRSPEHERRATPPETKGGGGCSRLRCTSP